MHSMTIEKAASACGGRLVNCAAPDTPLGAAVIDSRKVQPGDLFAAYRGEKTDGHRFVRAAEEKGAVCALCEALPEDAQGPVILVENVQTALEAIAESYRKTLSIPVVGVTGSVGKTTGKEMVAAVLSRRFRVLKTEGNHNNQIGVPMTISRIEPEHEAAVVEMGISDFGEMRGLARIARPTVALFTVIGRAHLEFLHDLEGVMRAKTEMLEYLPDDGVILLNGDDAMLRTLQSRQRQLRFGMGEDCDVRALEPALLPDGSTRCRIVCGQRQIEAKIPAYGLQMVYAALEGAAAGIALGLTDEEIEQGIAVFRNVGRRSNLENTGLVTLLDDSYNANPDSMRCGVDSLSELPGRHVCVLADMRELGGDSPRLHRELGAYVREKGTDLLLCYGEMSACMAEGAGDIARHYPSREALLEELPKLLRPGDSVLVKASLSMGIGAVAEAIRGWMEL